MLGSCGRPSLNLEPGSYRATLDIPAGKSVPFGLDVAREETGFVLYLLNGQERVRVPDVQATPGQLTARMPGYENMLHATIRGGRLEGHLTLVHGDGQALELPFHARLGDTWRFHSKPLHDNADLQGRWQVTFSGTGGRDVVPGIAEFMQRFAEVTGTVVTPAGDQRYLAGEVRDELLQLSRFDGGAVVLYEAKLDADGRLVGEAWSDRAGTRHFVASRNADVSYDSILQSPAEPADPIPFQFTARDVDGRTVTDDDARFAGKPLLVTLTASWSPSSRDEIGPLQRLAAHFRHQGLEVLALCYEQHAAFEPSAAAIQRFRDATRVTYPTMLAGRFEGDAIRGAPAPIGPHPSLPTWLVVDRAHRVVRVHPVFIGPAAGTAHEMMMREIERSLEIVLAAPAPVSPGSS
jgi:hypothetical protein